MVSRETINKNLNELRQKIGGCCLNCGRQTKCECAHIRETPILSQAWVLKKNGESRGNKHRYYDIIRHLNDYTYLCKTCHTAFDHDLQVLEMRKNLFFVIRD